VPFITPANATCPTHLTILYSHNWSRYKLRERSLWLRGFCHVHCSTSRKLGRKLKQPRGHGSVCVCVCVCVRARVLFVSALSCIGRVLANGTLLTQGDLPNVCKQNSPNRNNENLRSHRPGNTKDMQSKCAASSLCNFLNHPPLFFFPIRPKFSPHNFLLKQPTVYLLPLQRETTFHAHIKK